tara:strand:- start:1245 stop:1649 length:405 start_codon:yes stop_codon:yes gene_type:complete
MNVEIINVVAAVIRKDDKVLVCQRNLQKRHGGLWEFPGGKTLDNESYGDAIRREILEELAVEVSQVGPTLYSVREGSSPFLIHFIETIITGVPVPIEHHAIEWRTTGAISHMEMAPADKDFTLNCLSKITEGSA